jgi:hypothetical protein
MPPSSNTQQSNVTPALTMPTAWFPSSNPAPSNTNQQPPPVNVAPAPLTDANFPKDKPETKADSPDAPTSDKNSAPPPIEHPTPETKNDPIPFSQIVGGFVFIILAYFAIYYGWVLGQFQGREYLLYVQSFGPWVRDMAIKIYNYIRSWF